MHGFRFFVIFQALLLLFCGTISAQEDDPFGDPFAEIEKDPETEESGETDEGDGTENSEFSPPPLEVYGTISLHPILYLNKVDGDYAEPFFPLSSMDGRINVRHRMGNIEFFAGFSAGAVYRPNTVPETAVDVEELYFRHLSDFSDVTVGRFSPEWSPMNVFKLSDFFAPQSGLLFGGSGFTRVSTGLRAIFYYKIFSFEGIYLPFYTASTPFSEYASELFNFSPYPDTVPVNITDNEPGMKWDTLQAAFRAGLDFGFADFYFFGRHGYLPDAIITSETVFTPPADLMLEVTKKYPKVNSLGLTAISEVWRIIFNAEASVTFDYPLIVTETVSYPDPIGTVENRSMKAAASLRWSAGFDWEIFKNIRIIGEYSDFHLLEDISDVDTSRNPGDTVFGALDVILPAPKFELGFTTGPLYDWSGGEFTYINSIRTDFFNGISMELSGIYFDVFKTTDSTTEMYEELSGDFLFDLNIEYTF
jgi:hypothetical protein